MFKELLVPCMLLLLFVSSYADIHVLQPADMELANNAAIDFGQIAKGETLLLTVVRDSGKGFEWDAISVDEEMLPENWRVEKSKSDETLVLRISIPSNAATSIQKLSFELKSDEQPTLSESFSARLTVKENLLNSWVEFAPNSTSINQPVEYRLVLNNESIASHKVRVESSLPSYWFSPFTADLNPKETKQVLLEVNPRAHGVKQFSLSIVSELNSAEFHFPQQLNVFPTLNGKYSAALYGFPFFSLSLLPFYLVNSLASLLW